MFWERHELFEGDVNLWRCRSWSRCLALVGGHSPGLRTGGEGGATASGPSRPYENTNHPHARTKTQTIHPPPPCTHRVSEKKSGSGSHVQWPRRRAAAPAVVSSAAAAPRRRRRRRGPSRALTFGSARLLLLMPAPAGAQIVLGAVAFGKPKPTTRDHPLSSDEACSELLTAFAAHGGRELDTARIYQNGNCEAMLGRLPSARQLRIATKFHPTGMPGTITEQLDQSLVALNRDSVEIFYPHMPATDSDLEKTLAELNACHRAGKFVELGLSNYPAWQVCCHAS
eukprot:COSAG01_NODE_1338_length_10666_cov_79.971231_10_plen_284_part_00